jgi:hypothetical protein
VPSTTVRIKLDTSKTLRELAAETGRSMTDVLADAVDAYARQVLLDRTNVAYAALRSDEGSWAEELEEREAWETTLGDGLDDE